MAGLLWAYMGPQPAPELPVWEPFTWDNGFREIVTADSALQLVPMPGELHRPGAFRMDARELELAPARAATRSPPRHLKLKFEEFEHGFIYNRVREGGDEKDRELDRRPRRAVAERVLSRQPFRMARAGRRREHAERRVVLHAGAQGPRALRAEKRADLAAPIKDAQRALDRSHVINQDIIAWVGQGRIADRTKENLRSSDIGITMMRKRFFEDMDKVAKGEDPSGVIRDPATARMRRAARHDARNTMSRACRLPNTTTIRCCSERLDEFRHHYGQPPEVRRAFGEAMGI